MQSEEMNWASEAETNAAERAHVLQVVAFVVDDLGMRAGDKCMHRLREALEDARNEAVRQSATLDKTHRRPFDGASFVRRRLAEFEASATRR